MLLRPQVANLANWQDVSIQQEQIMIKGGFHRKGDLVDVIRYKCDDNVIHTFVALHKEAPWFVKGAGGSKKGDLKAVNVLQMLRHKVRDFDLIPHDAEPCPAVAGSDSQSSVFDAADDDDDPMESMISRESVADSIVEIVPRQQPTQNNAKKRKVDRAAVQELTVPTRLACVGGASLLETKIVVYTQPDKQKNAVLHLRLDFINWLLSYAADELACQGVQRVDASSGTSPEKPNCEVDNVFLEWNFGSKRWEAVFLAGSVQGEMVHFGANDVTPALLAKLRQLDLADQWYSKTSTYTRKHAARAYVLLWCKAINNNTLDEHNAIFEPLLTVRPTNAANTDSDTAEDGTVLVAHGNSDADVSDAEAGGLSAGETHE